MIRIIDIIYARVPVRSATGIVSIAFGLLTMFGTNRGTVSYMQAVAPWIPTAFGTVLCVCGVTLIYRAFTHVHAVLSVFIVLCIPLLAYFLTAFLFWLSDTTTPFTPIVAYIFLIFFMLLCFWQERKLAEGKLNDLKRTQ